jgi:hypothetical protein
MIGNIILHALSPIPQCADIKYTLEDHAIKIKNPISRILDRLPGVTAI